jgi:hypothetical protein
MSTINKLTFVPLTIAPETQPEQKPAEQSATGIANVADGFESASPSNAEIFTMMQQPSQSDSQILRPPEAGVDTSAVFENIMDLQDPQPPPPPEPPVDESFGKTLEDFTGKTIKDAYYKNSTYDFDPNRKATSDKENYGKDVGMPENLGSLGGRGGKTIGELEDSWSLFEIGKIDEKAEGDWGSAYAKGSTKILGVSGKVYYRLGADFEKKTLEAAVGAKGAAEIVGVHYEAGYDTPDVEIGDSKVDLNTKVNLDAQVGVKGYIEGGLSIGKENNLKLGAGGFDGADASLKGKIGAGELGDAHGYIAAWAGVGAKAGFDVGFKDGKLKADMGLGLALGAGLEWDLGVTLDFGEIVDTGLDTMREIGLGDEADWIENTAGDVFEFAGDAAHWAGDAAEDAADAIGDAASDAGDAAGDVIDDIGDAAEDVGDTLGDAADEVGGWFDDWP